MLTNHIKLKELIKVFDAAFTTVSAKGTYDSGSIIPEELMNSIVKSIKMDKNRILITWIQVILDESKKVKTLEELGYSFETGV